MSILDNEDELYGCFNCQDDIHFSDFCSYECEQEWLEKHPDYPFRGERERCCRCGSTKKEIISDNIEMLTAGNILIEGSMQKRPIQIIKYLCQECRCKGTDLVMLS